MMERHSYSSLSHMIVLLSERMYLAFPPTFVQINNFNFYSIYSSFFNFVPKYVADFQPLPFSFLIHSYRSWTWDGNLVSLKVIAIIENITRLIFSLNCKYVLSSHGLLIKFHAIFKRIWTIFRKILPDFNENSEYF